MCDSSRIPIDFGRFWPTVSLQTIESLGGAGGFSGARIWRVASAAGVFCLRKWPREHPNPKRLAWIHGVLAHVALHGVDILPLPKRTASGKSFAEHQGHLWELAPWLPGEADYFERPSRAKLQAAFIALAHFHRATASFENAIGVAPAVTMRCKRLDALLSGGITAIERNIQPGDWPELVARAARVVGLAATIAQPMRRELEKHRERRVPLQPAICDVWHDHVFYVGDRVSGLVDFGAMRIDTIATDVARLVGSMAGDDGESRTAAIAAYETVSPLADGEGAFIHLLDRSGIVIGALHWLDWIYRQGRRFDDRATIVARLDTMLARMEAW